LTSQYRSNKSVAKNPTISIDVDDPRVSWDKIKQTLSRQGSEIDIIGLDGKPLIAGGANLTSSANTSDNNTKKPKSIKDPDVPGKGVPPLAVTNLVGDWGPNGGITLTFDFDKSDIANIFIDRFLVKVYDSETEDWTELKAGFGYPGSTFLSSVSDEQTLFLSAKDIDQSLDISTIISNITKVAVATADILNVGEYVEANMPEFASDLPQPEFTLSAGIDYYVVTFDPTNIALAVSKGNFLGAIVEEKVTTETIKANVGTTGWVQAAPISSGTSVVVYTPDGLQRWVRVRYVKTYGEPSIYSDIKNITPLPFQPTNTNPPTQFTSASIAWSGNDITVSFAQPSTNAGNTVKVKLVPYVNGVESTSLYAHFYHVIVPPETSFKILALDMFGQFSAYYSQFKAYITSVSAQGIETTGAVISAGPIQRSNPLANIYPTLGTPNINTPSGIFRVTPSASGYIVDFDMPAGATRLEVYEKTTAWTTIPVNDNNVVYSGTSPASIPTADYNKRYVIVRYYDQYDNYSYYSMEKTGQTSGVEVTPIDVGLESLIQFPIKISTNGSIFAGAGDHTVNPKVFFNTSGLFAYDAGGVATTQIINDALANTPTFITQNARIAEWSIDKQTVGSSSINYIQNNLYAATKTKEYAGISSNGTYSFWAGANSSLNTDGLAEFSVKPNGEVVASKITINGNGTGSDLIRAGGSNFVVTQAGGITARSAVIKGTIEVDGQSYFDANVNVRNGYLIAGSGGVNVGPNVQIGSMGLQALNASNAATTKIYSSPLSVDIINAVTGATDTVTGITLWSKKVLFGTNESTGWVISDGVIQANYVSLSSADQSLILRSKSSLSTKGIVIRATNDTGYAISAGNIADPSSAPFSVTTQGDLYAQNATIQGTVKASLGGFGYYNPTTAALVNGWNITGSDTTASITATGTANIDLSSGGSILVGDYKVTSSGTNFVISQISNGLNLMKTESVAGATEDPLRIFLGDSTRQTEVAKSAQISGNGTNLQFGADTTTNNAYRSGGLRNMYTVSLGNASSAIYPSALKGDVLLVYDSTQGL
jgi:hypothetical protein